MKTRNFSQKRSQFIKFEAKQSAFLKKINGGEEQPQKPDYESTKIKI